MVDLGARGLLDRPAAVLGEAAVQRQLHDAIGRAYFDRPFAAALLANPTLALGDAGCTPQQRLALMGIQAANLRQFAAQAEALFWPSRSTFAVERQERVFAAAR